MTGSVGTVFSKSKHKNANNNQNNGSDLNYGLTTHSSHLMPNPKQDMHYNTSRPNSEELVNSYDPHLLTTDERQLSLPNLDQLTDDDINNQFESMLVRFDT